MMLLDSLSKSEEETSFRSSPRSESLFNNPDVRGKMLIDGDCLHIFFSFPCLTQKSFTFLVIHPSNVLSLAKSEPFRVGCSHQMTSCDKNKS